MIDEWIIDAARKLGISPEKLAKRVSQSSQNFAAHVELQGIVHPTEITSNEDLERRIKSEWGNLEIE